MRDKNEEKLAAKRKKDADAIKAKRQAKSDKGLKAFEAYYFDDAGKKSLERIRKREFKKSGYVP